MSPKQPRGRAERVAAVVEQLAAAFGVEATGPLYAAYTAGLDGMSADEVEAAGALALRGCKWMPKPAELRALVRGDPKALAVPAWESVLSAMLEHGSYVSVDFEDKAINAAVRSMGGWPRLCLREGDDLHTWARKEFLAAYESFASIGVPEETGACLPGRAEEANGERFAEHTPMKRIAAPMRRLAAGRRSLPPGDGA